MSGYGKIIVSLSILISSLTTGAVLADEIAAAEAPLFSFNVPMLQSAAGSLTVAGKLGGVEAEFLLDTGANMVTVDQAMFKQIKSRHTAVKVSEMGARLASGRVEIIDVYRVESFTLAGGCELGPTEFAVMKRGGRNLLGMNALNNAAPFAISTAPPELSLSSCLMGGDLSHSISLSP